MKASSGTGPDRLLTSNHSPPAASPVNEEDTAELRHKRDDG